MSRAQQAGVFAIIAALLLGALIEGRALLTNRTQMADLESQNAFLKNRLAHLTRDHADTAKQIASLTAKSHEVQGAIDDSTDPTSQALTAWLTRVSLLKKYFQDHPDKSIPEFQYLKATDWLSVTRKDLANDDDYRHAAADIRSSAMSAFVGQVLQPSLQKYLKVSGNQFPTDLSQLQPYFDDPNEIAEAQQYRLVPSFAIPNMSFGGTAMITRSSYVDSSLDNIVAIGQSGYGEMGPQGGNLLPVLSAFETATGGQSPTDIAQLLPYATTTDQQTMITRVIQRHAPR